MFCHSDFVLYIVFFVLVFGSLVAGTLSAGLFVFDYCAIILCGIADVVPCFIYLIGALVSVPVFVHGIEEDEDAQGGSRDDTHHHTRSAAGLTYYL